MLPAMATFDTKLVHAGEPRPRIAGAVTLPVFQSSTFEYAGPAAYEDIRYIRLNNTPNHHALHEKLAALEGAEAALVTSSGMAAISTALLASLAPGDHVLVQRCPYGGTHDLFTGFLARVGIAHTFVAGDDPAAWEQAVRPQTRMFYAEAISNPLLEVADHAAAVAFCRARGLLSVIDATFASPAVFRPIEHGYDLVLHLNGHSDLVAGAVVGTRERVDAVRKLLALLGGALDPHACFLLHRGLKTLGLRVRRQCDTALQVARFLAEHPAVARVSYPGLPDHPGHARAQALFQGFGGMLAFEHAGGAEAADRMAARLHLPVEAPSLGGPETLVTRPATTSHAGMDPEVRRRSGIGDGLVRVSIGLEDPQDLIADFAQAL
jgi:cystathionine beta-lyase/cystathionine gamma-synthase